MGSIPIGGSIFYFPEIRSMLLASVLLRTDSIVAPASARPWIMRQARIRMDRIRFHDSRSGNCSVPSMDFTIEEGDRGQMMVSALPSYARRRASKTPMPFFLAVLR